MSKKKMQRYWLQLPYISVSKGMKQRIHINVTKDLFSFFQIYLDRGVFFYLVPSVKVLSMELVPPNREKCLAGAEMVWTGRQTHLISHQLISNSMVPWRLQKCSLNTLRIYNPMQCLIHLKTSLSMLKRSPITSMPTTLVSGIWSET